VVGAVTGGASIIALFIVGAISNSSSANPLIENLGKGAVALSVCAPIAACLGCLPATLDSKLWLIRR
jgi:hypothetical protein